ncbi:MAG: hypothetical protein H7287_12505 [Thermoleophilia bacterium]|nr:hypothetical protein [Thermoleophilia bacterium]
MRGIEAPLLLELLATRDTSTDTAPGDPVTTDATAVATGPTPDSVEFWSGACAEERPLLDLAPPPADAPLVRALGPVPFWRGLDDFEPTMRALHGRLRGDAFVLDVALGLDPQQN